MPAGFVRGRGPLPAPRLHQRVPPGGGREAQEVEAADERRVIEVTPIARPGRRRRLVRAAAGAFLLLSLLAASPTAQAQALDPTSAAALAETLRILGDPSARGAATAGDPGARDIDR